MKSGQNFLQEDVIYEYLNARNEDGSLRLKHKVKDGIRVGREKWFKVKDLGSITSTAFPDVESITFVGSKKGRPAEVKFATSDFHYHKGSQHAHTFRKFAKNDGFLLVVNHDEIPEGISDIDVYELDQTDFISFCRENFPRLLSGQIRSRTGSKIWVMNQERNFHEDSKDAKAAKDSGIWYPSENLGGLDLDIGDRVLFVRPDGSSRKRVEQEFKKGKIPEEWMLTSIWIGEISSRITSRREYSHSKHIPYDTKLWRDDRRRIDGSWGSNRVFSFKRVKEIKKELPLQDLHKSKNLKDFVVAVAQVFITKKSKEITPAQYRSLLEYLT